MNCRELQLGPQNPAGITKSVCIRRYSRQSMSDQIFWKIMKNVFYAEFQGESNGTIHFALHDLNHLKNPKN